MRNPRFTLETRWPPQSRPNGFTLVEILTVVAIISILMTAGAIGLGNLTAGKGTATAIATAESLFNEARTLAVSRQTRARVMIDIGDIRSENYLRRVIVVYEETDTNGKPVDGSWILSSRSYNVPQGTYFSQVYSKGQDGSDIERETNFTPKNDASPPTDLANYRSNYAYYEFNSQGIFASPGTSFIIGSGLRLKNAEPKTAASGLKDFAGFVVWRNGRTSVYRSPKQMGAALDGHGSNQNF